MPTKEETLFELYQKQFQPAPRTTPTNVYGGLGEVLNTMKPQRNPEKEKEISRVAKTAAWTDMLKTMMEGIAMTYGQNTGNGAMSNVVPRGISPVVTQGQQKLDELDKLYNDKEAVYNQQLLRQKLLEAQALDDANKYNAGLDQNELEWRKKIFLADQQAKAEGNKDAENRKSANYRAKLDYDAQMAALKNKQENENKPKWTIPDGKGGMVPIQDEGQLYSIYNSLSKFIGDGGIKQQVDERTGLPKPITSDQVIDYITKNKDGIARLKVVYDNSSGTFPYQNEYNQYKAEADAQNFRNLVELNTKDAATQNSPQWLPMIQAFASQLNLPQEQVFALLTQLQQQNKQPTNQYTQQSNQTKTNTWDKYIEKD